jgi:hypothetical protein
MDRALETEVGVFKGCFTMYGRISDDKKKDILAYLNRPAQARWLDIRGYVVTGSGTLWQAWCACDLTAPRSGNRGFPSLDVLLRAIRSAVDQRSQQITERLQETSPVGLRVL